jgi:hypothetical protein
MDYFNVQLNALRETTLGEDRRCSPVERNKQDGSGSGGDEEDGSSKK